MAPRLSGQTSIFGAVFFVSKSLLGIERQKKLEKFTILTRKPRSHARILIYRTWPINSLNTERAYKLRLSGSARQSEIGILCFDWLIRPGVSYSREIRTK